MATNGYIRQSNFTDGDVIDDSLFNNEYNQLAIAFDKDSGHTHDGSEGQGAAIPFLLETISGTKANAGTDEFTLDIDSIASLFTFTKGLGGEAYINGYDIDGLQLELDSKYSAVNQPTWDDIQDKEHVHDIADVTGLQLALDDKSDVGHSHVISDTVGLQDALDAAGGTDVTKTIDSAATQTLTREAPLTFVIITTVAARSITLNNSTFGIGDVVEIDVMPAGTVTVITDSGTIFIQDGTNGTSHTLTALSGVMKLTKIDTSNWRLRMYN